MNGKIKSIEKRGSWTGTHGTMYTYYVEIESNSGAVVTGEANAKAETIEGLPYKIGDMVEYEHQPSDNPSYDDKLQIKKEGYSGDASQPNYSGGKAKGSNRSFALAYAKDLAVAVVGRGGMSSTGQITPRPSDESIIETAQKFVEWLDS